MMKTFALVDKGIVTNLVVGDDPTIFPNEQVIELQTRPEIGWVFNPEDGSFSPPVIDPTNPEIVTTLLATDIVSLNEAIDTSKLPDDIKQELKAKITIGGR